MNNRYYKGKYSWIKHLDFITLDCITLFISFLISYFLRFGDLSFAKSESWRLIIILIIVMNLLIITFMQSFSGVLKRKWNKELSILIYQTVYNIIAVSFLLYLVKRGADYSRIVIVSTYLINVVIGFLSRCFYKRLIRKNLSGYSINIFIFAESNNIARVLESLNASFTSLYNISGICLVDRDVNIVGDYVKVSMDDALDCILSNNIEDVIVATKPSNIDSNLTKSLTENGKNIHFVLKSILGFEGDDYFMSNIGTLKTVTVGMFSFNSKQLVYFFFKRIVDILFAIVGLILMLPIALVIKVSYLSIGDKKSIFYSHTRIGKNGEKFKLIKFRSMVHNADEILKEMLTKEEYRIEWEENQKFENDPRITKVGNFIRKTSIDEIPQFINVLKGDMSLVGPRPLVEGELELHNGLQLYNKVKPGITGWWGCNGRSTTTYEDRLELEYFYVKNCSLHLDLVCIVKTIIGILKKEGAK